MRTQWRTRLERHIFPHIGERYIDTLTPQDIATALSPIWNEIPETARNIRQQLNDIFKVYVATGALLNNLAALVHQILPKQAAKVQHQPAIPWQLIASFLLEYVTNKKPLAGARAALLFLILTATRSGEVRGMTWHEVDLKQQLWIITLIWTVASKNYQEVNMQGGGLNKISLLCPKMGARSLPTAPKIV